MIFELEDLVYGIDGFIRVIGVVNNIMGFFVVCFFLNIDDFGF